MITLLLIVLPLAAAAVAAIPGDRTKLRRAMLLLGALGHFCLTVTAVAGAAAPTPPCGGTGWIGLDELGLVFLCITSLLFFAVTIHALVWLPAEIAAGGHGGKIQQESIFIPCMLAFLGTMTLVIASRNFGLLWVAVEATTLVSAPLICFHRNAQSLEAVWKYLLICSVGIGLALFGTMLLAMSAGHLGHLGLNMKVLGEHSGQLNPLWFKGAFIFILAGYGTKMGLAPFHTWLPDAHSEAPGIVSALLSGSLLNCSFLGIIRFYRIAPESILPFCNQLMIALGILSLVIPAFFIIRQHDFKRMLAYSSVEHMGLAALLWGFGLQGVALLHLCGHSVIKMTLFLLAGNILLAYGTRSIPAIGGMFGKLPKTAVLWTIGILLICGTPPSPLFLTEFLLVRGAGLWMGALILLLLFAVFAGMTMAVLNMCMGKTGKLMPPPSRLAAVERLWVIPAAALSGALLMGALLLWRFNLGGC